MPGYHVQPAQLLEVFVTRIGAQEIIAAATPQGLQLIRLSLTAWYPDCLKARSISVTKAKSS
jgi:hypothetical protein